LKKHKIIFFPQVLDEILANPDPRVCDKILVTSLTIENISRIYEVYGKKATQLDISNWHHTTYNAQELLDTINLFTNLKSLEFTWHKDEFVGEPSGSLKANIKKVILVDNSGKNKNIAINFLNKVLPENILTSLEIEDDENYGSFLGRQRNIKDLLIDVNDPIFSEAFNNLKLEKLKVFVSSSSVDEEKYPERRKFLKAVIKSQPDLKQLELVKGDDFLHQIVDDEIFQVIKNKL
jgi:hypothetical protein